MRTLFLCLLIMLLFTLVLGMTTTTTAVTTVISTQSGATAYSFVLVPTSPILIPKDIVALSRRDDIPSSVGIYQRAPVGDGGSDGGDENGSGSKNVSIRYSSGGGKGPFFGEGKMLVVLVVAGLLLPGMLVMGL